MCGLRRIARLYGGMTVTSNGKTVKYAWDYDADCPVLESEMPVGSERWKKSQEALWRLARTESQEKEAD